MYSYTNAYLKQEGERALDLTHLRYFQAAARTQNFTKAAEEAHISQPAFSASLSKLEKELGVRLFDRIGRRIQLNECGKLYIKYVDQALACLDEGDRKLSEAGREKKRRFSLGTVSVPLVQELLSDFRVAYPDVAVRRYELLSQDVDSELADSDSGSDIILTAALGEMAEGPGCRVIKREPLFVALYRGHPLAEREALSVAELREERFISLPEGYSFREITEQLCRSAGFEVDIVHECFHCQLLACISDEIGVALVTEDTVKQERMRKGGSDILFPALRDENAFRSVALRWDPERALPEAARQFVDFALCYYGGER